MKVCRECPIFWEGDRDVGMWSLKICLAVLDHSIIQFFKGRQWRGQWKMLQNFFEFFMYALEQQAKLVRLILDFFITA
jgi:hypothetical protein